ncbi:MAG TPA: DUF934 domain-containing protein [Burkholderiaceae bacterium]|nr:DUF934 domain-containing protein [Burkholderiaceae bacterium]
MSERVGLLRLVDDAPRLVADDWRIVESAAHWDGSAGAILPLELVVAQTERVRASGRAGIWLSPTDDPGCAVEFFDWIALIGVQFPKFTDGRGYSSAVLLRTRYGWRGELRALGDVLPDQLFALRRVGFDSFALRADQDPAIALRAFFPFSEVYQGSVNPPLPLFRRASTCT